MQGIRGLYSLGSFRDTPEEPILYPTEDPFQAFWYLLIWKEEASKTRTSGPLLLGIRRTRLSLRVKVLHPSYELDREQMAKSRTRM
jgi:hypothetical protein